MNLLPRDNRFDLDNLFESFFAPGNLSQDRFFSPKVDISETDTGYTIQAELAGVKKEDIHLELHHGVLTLSAEIKQEDKEEKGGRLIRQERRYGSIQRNFVVGDAVQQEDISAKFDNGLLLVSVPKVEEKEPEKKRINVV